MALKNNQSQVNLVEKKIQYTRCPKCQTAFRVNDKVLSIAKGKVRCGACLVVFQAADYIVRPKIALSQKTALSVIPKKQSAPKVEEQTALRGDGASLIAEEMSSEGDNILHIDEDIALGDDEILLSDEDPSPKGDDIPLFDEDTSLGNNDVSLEGDNVPPIENIPVGNEGTLLIDDSADNGNALTNNTEKFSVNFDPPAGEFEPLSSNLSDKMGSDVSEFDLPGEFEARVEKKTLSLRVLMVTTVIIFSFGFLANQFWSNRQTLAYDKTWAGVTNSLCRYLPCDIQPRKDVSKIKLYHRMVIPSEQDGNLLDIKIVIINEAIFAQPYPIINIKFSNSLAEPVAEKRFLVKDYFPSKQNELMSVGAEIHITFSTELPHPDALGFEFVFN